MSDNAGIKLEDKIAFVSKRVMRDGHAINSFFRERPIAAEDSGWRFFAGDEDGAFIANPENTGVYRVAEVLTREPGIRALLDREIGAAFDRNGTSEFEDVTGKQLYD